MFSVRDDASISSDAGEDGAPNEWYLYNGFSPGEIKHQIKTVLDNMNFNDEAPKYVPMGPEFSQFKRHVGEIIVDGMKIKSPIKKHQLRALIDRRIKALGKETEQIFWEKHEKDMLEVLMGEAGVEDYYRVRAKKEEKKRRKKEDKKKWDEEMEKLKMDFTALVEKEMKELDKISDELKIYHYLKGKADLENHITRKMQQTVQRTMTNIAEQFSSALKSDANIRQHFRFHYKVEENKLSDFRPVGRIESEPLLDELKRNEPANKYNVLYAFRDDACPCHAESSFLRRIHEAEFLLNETDKRLAEVTEDVQVVEGENAEIDAYNVVKRYQTYATFVAGALPELAEFFENVEKLMCFELTKLVAKRWPGFLVGHELVVRRSEPCVCKKSDVPLLTELRESHDRRVHDVESSSLYSTPATSGMLFCEDLNLREDFRNLVKKGLEDTVSNEVWNLYYECKLTTDPCMLTRSAVHARTRHECDLAARTPSSASCACSNVPDQVRTRTPSESLSCTCVAPPDEVPPSVASAPEPDPGYLKLMETVDSLMIARQRSLLASSVVDLFTHSSLRLAKDSVEVLRAHLRDSEKIRKRRSVPHSTKRASILDPRMSVRDSLEILTMREIRKSFESFRTRISGSDAAKSMKEVCLSLPPTNDSVSALIDFLSTIKDHRRSTRSKSVEKIVTISHFEIIPSVITDAVNSVAFDSQHDVIQYDFSSYESSLTQVSACETFLHRPAELKIYGQPDVPESRMTQREFLIAKMNAFSKLLNKYPFIRPYFRPKKTKTVQKPC